MSVCIAGGGLGGLALAHMLKRAGISAVVCERDRIGTSRDQGYAVGLIPKSLELLRSISSPQLHAVLHRPENQHSSFAMLDARGSRVMTIAGNQAAGQFVDRPALRAALLQDSGIQFSKAVATYVEHDDAVAVTFADGSTQSFDCLIGADGASSVVRRLKAPLLKTHDLNITNVAGWLPYERAPALLREVTATGLARSLGPDGHTIMALQYHGSGADRTGGNVQHVMLWALSHPGLQSAWLSKFRSDNACVDDEHDGQGSARVELRDMYERQVISVC